MVHMLPMCNCAHVYIREAAAAKYICQGQSKLINQPSKFSIIKGSDSYKYVCSLILKLNAIENEYCQQRKHSTDKILVT